MKTCKDCNKTKEIEEFSKNNTTSDRRNSICKVCHRNRYRKTREMTWEERAKACYARILAKY
jgi:hypothetical protein